MTGVMGPTQSPYILQLCMGPSYFSGGLTPPGPLISHPDATQTSDEIYCFDKLANSLGCANLSEKLS